VFCFWDKVSLTLHDMASNGGPFCFCLPATDYISSGNHILCNVEKNWPAEYLLCELLMSTITRFKNDDYCKLLNFRSSFMPWYASVTKRRMEHSPRRK
jgi:hypothetical protein